MHLIPTHIRSLDPLNADRALRALPSMNARGDVRAIVRTLSGLVPSVGRLTDTPVDEASAMMRISGCSWDH
ncbi:hypothetical protein [Streptomyces sp. B93]|uniref:hypothetical protein n=1 Tax=Streptomyces sp. B93 TaxID=2824875 RepID=UPI001B364ADB|nr:hypothetical protein [Streptomyces sp. B93]MBQ1092812.1 hypothetical protein [Streptomyces sp. B93]